MRLVWTSLGQMMPAIMVAGFAACWFDFVATAYPARAIEPSDLNLQEQADGLMKNADEMLAHGGMGDAKAIVHHCGETTRYAEALIRRLLSVGGQQDDALTRLNEVVRQCDRVSAIGIHADPGLLLNPAIKARAAARESLKGLGLLKPNKG